jgi:hypothetical protein
MRPRDKSAAAKKWIRKTEECVDDEHVHAARPAFLHGLISLRVMNSLLELPAKLLLAIFRAACTDNGFTAAALSATSRRSRELMASTSVGYETIALFGHKAVFSFTRLVESRNVVVPLLVKHLLITDNKQPRGGHHPALEEDHPAAPYGSQGASNTGSPNFHRLNSRRPRDPSRASAYARRQGFKYDTIEHALQILLEHLSATLVHLAIVLWTHHPHFLLVPKLLPHLTELTCWFQPQMQTRTQHSLQRDFYVSLLERERSLLPTLQRLHMIGSSPMRASYCMQTILHQITHLRLSNEASEEYMAELSSDQRLVHPQLATDQGTWLSPALTHILLALPKKSVGHIQYARILLSVLRDAGHRMSRVMELLEDGTGYTFLQAYEDWQERALDQGSGCWHNLDGQ